MTEPSITPLDAARAIMQLIQDAAEPGLNTPTLSDDQIIGIADKVLKRWQKQSDGFRASVMRIVRQAHKEGTRTVDPWSEFERIFNICEAEAAFQRTIGDQCIRRICPMRIPLFSGNDQEICFIDGDLSALDGRLDFSIYNRLWYADNEEISRYREVPLSSIRGRYTRLAKRMVVCDIKSYHRSSNEVLAVSEIIGTNDNGRSWIPCTRDQSFDRGGETESRDSRTISAGSAERVAAAIGLQFALEYFWSVEIAMSNPGASILVPLELAGIRRILKDRSIPPGKVRRQYIKTLVQEHCRKSGETDETLVREHIKNRKPISIDGYIAYIRAPLSEVRRITKKYNYKPPISVVKESKEHLAGVANIDSSKPVAP